MFASRTGWSREPNALSRAADKARTKAGFIDLTVSNPTQVGFAPEPSLLTALAHAEATTYSPEPLGLSSAREAVAAYYERRGVVVSPERIVLTPTTSDAYTYLFRLLVDSGAVITAPAPSYPLFSFLAELCDANLTPYRLLWKKKRWTVDLATVVDAKATIVVQPNNPTGSILEMGERSEIIKHARRCGGAIISDEVFLDYVDKRESRANVSFANESSVLCFTLSGLSKVAALPQMKLSWIVVSGPDELVLEALGRLEIIADTYLSVATPIQLAAGICLNWAETVQNKINARLVLNRTSLGDLGRPTAGGWYAILPLKEDTDDERYAMSLVEHFKLLVHPGHFFDLEEPAIVVSLLTEPSVFSEALTRLKKRGTGSVFLP